MKKRVLVFGSYVTDLCARASAFPKAGETIAGHYFKMGPGGKGSNQAVAAKRAGASVTFITKLGDDPLGKQAADFYRAEGLYGEGILVDKTEPTGAALIMVNELTAQNQIVVIGGACTKFTPEDTPGILKLADGCDIILTQLETNLLPVYALLEHAKEHDIQVILNPAPAQPLADEYYPYVDVITPNETEAQTLTGIPVTDMDSAAKAAQALLQKGARRVVITMGSMGCYAHNGESGQAFGTVNCGKAVDTTGAGDAFSGGLTAALAHGYNFFDAVRYGSVVAGIAVTRHGTAPAMPTQVEIEKVYSQL